VSRRWACRVKRSSRVPVSREHGGQLCRAEPELYHSPLMSAADQRKWVPLDEQKKKGPVIAWGMTGPERVGSCILVGKFLDELFLSTVRSTWRRSDTRHPPRRARLPGPSRSCKYSKARDYQRHLKEHDPDQESNAANATSSSGAPCRTNAGSCRAAINTTFLDGNWGGAA
jgi:hypothetical protein